MILHYLGLDHIGHTAGPQSSLVKPKLKEMDNVIKKIYTAMTHWVTFLLLSLKNLLFGFSSSKHFIGKV